MIRLACLCFLGVAAGLEAADDEFVFRSDVSLVRVDAQVVDRNGRAITGLQRDDFILTEEGRPQEIRNFGSEDLPVDILLLLDVSGSMRVHVERLASAAARALEALGADDRVAIMVFDRQTRLRMPFRGQRAQIEAGLQHVLNSETFSGGTDITRALYEAAQYVGRSARADARRAIVILTDDRTERGRDENGVGRALTSGNIVLSALLAPDAMGSGARGSWGGGTPGGIILGRRGPMGSRWPIPTGPALQSAGTAEIARKSGGDSFRVEEASALENTFARIRQRYALHFNLPEAVRPGQERNIDVELSAEARRRYPGAQVLFRRAYMAPGSPMPAAPPADEPVTVSDSTPPLKRRPAVSEPHGSTTTGPTPSGGWRRATPAEMESTEEAPDKQRDPPQRGWRRVKPGQEP